jgi:hypothetical protein
MSEANRLRRVTITAAASTLGELEGSPSGAAAVIRCEGVAKEIVFASSGSIYELTAKAVLAALRMLKYACSVIVIQRNPMFHGYASSGRASAKSTLMKALIVEASKHETTWMLLGQQDRETPDFLQARELARTAATEVPPEPLLF